MIKGNAAGTAERKAALLYWSRNGGRSNEQHHQISTSL
jgi:hypothetical protein